MTWQDTTKRGFRAKVSLLVVYCTETTEVKSYFLNVKLVGVARYTDVTVRYVPRFGGHGSI